MRRQWLLAATVLLLSGCAPSGGPSDSSSGVRPADAKKRPAAAAKGRPAKSDQESEKESPKHPLYDEFNLPLVIHIDAPDVPPEIQNPSPAP